MITKELQIDNLSSSFDDFFNDEENLVINLDDETVNENEEGWHILIVDDEPQVHEVTKMVLKTINFEDLPMVTHSAYSGIEAKEILKKNINFALILLDVVMETNESGLQLVNYIRKELKNKSVRIVLRTGQPGLSPEEDVVKKYDIDDYKSKSELTSQKLITSIYSSLRAYQEIIRIDKIVNEKIAEIVTLKDELEQSIVAARRIQTAMLPQVDYVSKYLSNFIVYYVPKDVVSGDFYWFTQYQDISFFANVDCSGHGVPGAMVSIFGYNLLNQIIENEHIFEPNEILKNLDSRLNKYLNKENEKANKFTMDISVLAIDHVNKHVSFSCANHTVFLILNNELIEIQGDKVHVGDNEGDSVQFTINELTLANDDKIFLFTDGITDQFGGSDDKKYGIKRLREILNTNKSKPLDTLMSLLTNEFDSWRANSTQTDDICFIGLQPFNK